MTSESFGHSARQSSAQQSAASRTGGGNAGPAPAQRTICAFWIGDRCFGLDTALVAEVVSVEERIPIPLAPAAVHGVFNLRGEPMPLISLANILGIPAESAMPKVVTAMVLRSGDLAAGLLIERVQAILPLEGAKLIPPANTTEDSSVLGFLEVVSDRLTQIVAVLDPANLLERLSQLRYQRDQSA